jgi:hypothetical protein
MFYKLAKIIFHRNDHVHYVFILLIALITKFIPSLTPTILSLNPTPLLIILILPTIIPPLTLIITPTTLITQTVPDSTPRHFVLITTPNYPHVHDFYLLIYESRLFTCVFNLALNLQRSHVTFSSTISKLAVQILLLIRLLF